MTLAAVARHGSTAGDPGAGYVPGVCNIGLDEIARRRRAGHIGTALTLGLLVVFFALGTPPLARFIVALPAAGAAAGYLQAWLRFCAAFGSVGEFNFGPLGRRQPVDDPVARRKDRARAVAIGGASALIGLVVGLAAVLLPV